MTWQFPIERRLAFNRRLRWLAWAAAVVGLSLFLDQAAFRALAVGKSVEGSDWWRALRSVGYLPTWIAVALAIGGASIAMSAGLNGKRVSLKPAVLIALAPTLAGIAAEVMKLVLARQRPGMNGEIVWRGLFSGFAESGNLGLPSSHATVAFGAAAAVGAAYPGARVVALALAIGCAYTRLAAGAHVLSDVTAGALLGYAVGLLTARRMGILPARSVWD